MKIKRMIHRDTGAIYEYDKNGNQIYYKTDSYEEWNTYDENNNLIHYKNSIGDDYYYEYDDNNTRLNKQDYICEFYEE